MEFNPISYDRAEHYIWGGKCDGWHLVKGEQLSVIEEQMPAGSAEVVHYHQAAQQFFYVLSGEAIMQVDRQQVHLSTGEGLHIPPRIQHCIRNNSDRPVHFLVVSQPPSHGDRVDVPQ